MSSSSPDSAEADAVAALNSAVSNIQSGTSAITSKQLVVSGIVNSGTAFMAITGYSSATPTATNSMYHTLVHSTGATTYTVTGYARVTITDSAGNLINGDHYIQLGALT
jgi:hypothetical protein